MAKAGAEDNRNIGSNPAQGLGQLLSCKVGHSLIRDHQIKLIRSCLESVQCLLGDCVRVDLIAQHDQHVLNRLHEPGLVIYQEETAGATRRGGRGGGGCQFRLTPVGFTHVGKVEGKSCAFTNRRIYRNRPTVAGDNRMHERQPHTGAFTD